MSHLESFGPDKKGRPDVYGFIFMSWVGVMVIVLSYLLIKIGKELA